MRRGCARGGVGRGVNKGVATPDSQKPKPLPACVNAPSRFEAHAFGRRRGARRRDAACGRSLSPCSRAASALQLSSCALTMVAPALPAAPAAKPAKADKTKPMEAVTFTQLYRYLEGWDYFILFTAVCGSLGTGARGPKPLELKCAAAPRVAARGCWRVPRRRGARRGRRRARLPARSSAGGTLLVPCWDRRCSASHAHAAVRPGVQAHNGPSLPSFWVRARRRAACTAGLQLAQRLGSSCRRACASRHPDAARACNRRTAAPGIRPSRRPPDRPLVRLAQATS